MEIKAKSQRSPCSSKLLQRRSQTKVHGRLEKKVWRPQKKSIERKLNPKRFASLQLIQQACQNQWTLRKNNFHRHLGNQPTSRVVEKGKIWIGFYQKKQSYNFRFLTNQNNQVNQRSHKSNQKSWNWKKAESLQRFGHAWSWRLISDWRNAQNQAWIWTGNQKDWEKLWWAWKLCKTYFFNNF